MVYYTKIVGKVGTIMDINNNLLQFTTNLLEQNGIPVQFLTAPSDVTEKVDLGLRAGILEYERATQDISTFFGTLEDNKVYFVNDIFECNYVAFRLPALHAIFLAGPVLWEPVSGDQFQKLFTRLDIPKDFEIPLFDYYKDIPIVGAHSFYESLFLQLAKELFPMGYTTEYISYEQSGSHLLDTYGIFKKPNQTFSYIDILSRRYDIENEIIRTVLSGNETLALETARKNLQVLATLPQRMTNQLRDLKNYMIAVNTVLRKSIELEHVHPIYIDATSGQFVVEIEQCASSAQIFDLFEKMILTYCKIAKETSHLSHSSFVDTVLTYINADLSGDLSLKSLANHLNVNASYLSALFSEEMGISLTNYVTQCRIQHAEKLLIHTGMTIKSVAQQCGFTDIHYFSRQFKKYTGESPKQYRENNQYLSDQKIISHLRQKKTKKS